MYIQKDKGTAIRNILLNLFRDRLGDVVFWDKGFSFRSKQQQNGGRKQTKNYDLDYNSCQHFQPVVRMQSGSLLHHCCGYNNDNGRKILNLLPSDR